MTTVDISGLDRAKVLAALNNNALVNGLRAPGMFQMTLEEAHAIIAANRPIDRFGMKSLKLYSGLRDDAPDQLDVTMYERDNSSAEPIIRRLRDTGEYSEM